MYLDWLDALSDHILRKLNSYIVLSRKIILLLSSSPEKTLENLFGSLSTYDFLFNCWLWIPKQCLLVLLSLTVCSILGAESCSGMKPVHQP